jgi:hypothetical protein
MNLLTLKVEDKPSVWGPPTKKMLLEELKEKDIFLTFRPGHSSVRSEDIFGNLGGYGLLGGELPIGKLVEVNREDETATFDIKDDDLYYSLLDFKDFSGSKFDGISVDSIINYNQHLAKDPEIDYSHIITESKFNSVLLLDVCLLPLTYERFIKNICY